MSGRIRARLKAMTAVLLALAAWTLFAFAEGAPAAAPEAGSIGAGPSAAPLEAAVGSVDLSEGGWVRQRIEAIAPLYDCDFVLNEACVYSGDSGRLTLAYATRASLADVRLHFAALLPDCVETGVNDAGNLNLSGTAGGRALTVRNYFSEVANLIELTLSEDDAALLAAVKAGFPEAAFAANGAFSEALKGVSDSGYVLYTYDEYDGRLLPGAPVFSRAYGVERAVEPVEMKERGALMAMEPGQVGAKPVAVLLYEAQPASQGA